MKNRFSSFTFAIALTLGVSALPAGATTITLGGTATPNSGFTTSVAGATVQTFDDNLMPSNYVVNGPGSIVHGSVSGQYTAPTGDTNKYLNTGIGTVTANFAGGINYLGLEWSTVDNYNFVYLTSTTGIVEKFGGSDLPPGNPVNGTTTSYVNFFADNGVMWKSVAFKSTGNSFELDNVATATPEPGSIAMLATGFLALGAGALRRRKTAARKA